MTHWRDLLNFYIVIIFWELWKLGFRKLQDLYWFWRRRRAARHVFVAWNMDLPYVPRSNPTMQARCPCCGAPNRVA